MKYAIFTINIDFFTVLAVINDGNYRSTGLKPCRASWGMSTCRMPHAPVNFEGKSFFLYFCTYTLVFQADSDLRQSSKSSMCLIPKFTGCPPAGHLQFLFSSPIAFCSELSFMGIGYSVLYVSEKLIA